MEPPNEPKPPPSNVRDQNHHQKQSNSELLLDLSLCTNDSDSGFDQENEKFNVENPQNPPDKSEPRVFSCNYCQRKFYSSQALGGHQNAHKRERTLAKRGQRITSTTFGNHYPDNFYKTRPYSSFSSSSSSSYPTNIASLPLYGSYYTKNHNDKHNNNINRNLGIQAHSLIHKSSPYIAFSSNGSSSQQHHGLWSRVPMIDQQKPGIGRLGMMMALSPSSSSSNGGGGVGAKFVQKINSQPLDRSVCWKGNTNKQLLQDHDHQLHKLDLSLKL